MYQQVFGTKQQIEFASEADYYEFLGYLAKNDTGTKLVWEPNDESGAWEQEGRILFYQAPPTLLQAELSHTAGVGNVESRVNCNEFVENILNNHNFVLGTDQNQDAIRSTIPDEFQPDFDRGLNL